MEHYSAIKKSRIMPFAATWVQPEIITGSEVGQKERQTSQNITYMWSLTRGTDEPIPRTGTDSQPERADLWLPRRRERGRRQTGSLRLTDAHYYIHRMDKQLGPTV